MGILRTAPGLCQIAMFDTTTNGAIIRTSSVVLGDGSKEQPRHHPTVYYQGERT